MKPTPEDDAVLATLYPSARAMYAAGELKPGTIVRTMATPFSRRVAVAGLDPLRVVPVKDF